MGIRLDGTNNTKVITAARGTHSSHTTSPTTTAVKGRLGITGRRKNGVPGRQSYDSGSRLGRSTSFSAVFTAALVSEMGQHYAKHQMQSGVRVYHQRHYRQAIARWRSALHRLKSAEDRFITLGYMAQAFCDASDYESMLHYALQQMELANTRNDDFMKSEAFLNLSKAYERLADYGRAIGYGRASLELPSIDSRTPGYVHLSIGQAQLGLSQFCASLAAFERAMSVANDTGDKLLELQICVALGSLFTLLRDLSKALIFLRNALTILQLISVDNVHAKYKSAVLYHLSVVLRLKGSPADARQACDEALRLAQQVGNRAIYARALASCADINRELGESEAKETITKSWARYEQAFRIMRQINDRMGEVLVLASMAKSASESRTHYAGQCECQAIQLNKKCLELAKLIGCKHAMMKCHQRLQELYAQLADEDSEEAARRATVALVQEMELFCNFCGQRYAENDDALQALRCSHIFHERCLHRFLAEGENPSCPKCKRKTISPIDSAPPQEELYTDETVNLCLETSKPADDQRISGEVSAVSTKRSRDRLLRQSALLQGDPCSSSGQPPQLHATISLDGGTNESQAAQLQQRQQQRQRRQRLLLLQQHEQNPKQEFFGSLDHHNKHGEAGKDWGCRIVKLETFDATGRTVQKQQLPEQELFRLTSSERRRLFDDREMTVPPYMEYCIGNSNDEVDATIPSTSGAARRRPHSMAFKSGDSEADGIIVDDSSAMVKESVSTVIRVVAAPSTTTTRSTTRAPELYSCSADNLFLAPMPGESSHLRGRRVITTTMMSRRLDDELDSIVVDGDMTMTGPSTSSLASVGALGAPQHFSLSASTASVSFLNRASISNRPLTASEEALFAAVRPPHAVITTRVNATVVTSTKTRDTVANVKSTHPNLPAADTNEETKTKHVMEMSPSSSQAVVARRDTPKVLTNNDVLSTGDYDAPTNTQRVPKCDELSPFVVSMPKICAEELRNCRLTLGSGQKRHQPPSYSSLQQNAIPRGENTFAFPNPSSSVASETANEEEDVPISDFRAFFNSAKNVEGGNYSPMVQNQNSHVPDGEVGGGTTISKSKPSVPPKPSKNLVDSSKRKGFAVSHGPGVTDV